MRKIAIVTATRAEYGLLSPIIKELRKKECNDFSVHLIVTGTHLCVQYGMTVNDIDDRVDHRITIPVKSDTEMDISDNQAVTLVEFTKLFFKEKYNAVILLGDRYETLAIAIAAGNTRIPIFHLCGGDTTEGAIDEWIRHSITKMSYLHFVTNEDSFRRVVQLGENPLRVFNYGSTSLDNIKKLACMNKNEALNSVGLPDCKYALCTYHPVTLENDCVDIQIEELIKAISSFPEIQFLITKSNADHLGSRINNLLDELAKKHDNIHVYTSLGMKRYLSLMKYAEFVIGNSSSGIIEAPAFNVPTVNIGDRQRGRLQSDSIINCTCISEDIIGTIKRALSENHKKICLNVKSPYGDGHASEKIAKKVYEIVMLNTIDLKKKFYNLNFEV